MNFELNLYVPCGVLGKFPISSTLLSFKRLRILFRNVIIVRAKKRGEL